MSRITEWILGGTPKQRREKDADTVFQIKVYDNSFWITYNGALICPTDMFNGEPIEVLGKIRRLYVERGE